jgi:peptidoglycan/xylan/chitin deacetylase (PgdA/CDA1 family)
MRQQVLCYHAISPDWAADLSVMPDRFTSQLEWLARRGYRGVTFSEAVELGIDAKVVAVTFDDAYRSVLALAAPVLDRLGWPATVFVPTRFPDVDGPMSWEGIDHWVGGPHEDEMRCMSWEQLRGLADRGWEIGSHTRTHPHLTRLADDELLGELRGSREECEAGVGRPCRSIAYPYGDYDDRVIEATGAAGYACAATLKALLPDPEPLGWPRTGIYHRDPLWRWWLKLSPAVTAARAAAAARAATREPARSAADR